MKVVKLFPKLFMYVTIFTVVEQMRAGHSDRAV
jgi:hypothetical protein